MDEKGTVRVCLHCRCQRCGGEVSLSEIPSHLAAMNETYGLPLHCLQCAVGQDLYAGKDSNDAVLSTDQLSPVPGRWIERPRPLYRKREEPRRELPTTTRDDIKRPLKITPTEEQRIPVPAFRQLNDNEVGQLLARLASGKEARQHVLQRLVKGGYPLARCRDINLGNNACKGLDTIAQDLEQAFKDQTAPETA